MTFLTGVLLLVEGSGQWTPCIRHNHISKRQWSWSCITSLFFKQELSCNYSVCNFFSITKVTVTKWAILSNLVCWEKKLSSILTGPPRSARGIGQHCMMLVLENGFLVNKGCSWQEARVLTIALSLQRLQPTPPCLLVKYWSSVHGCSLISWRTDWMKTRMQLKRPIWPGVGDWGSWTSGRV